MTLHRRKFLTAFASAALLAPLAAAEKGRGRGRGRDDDDDYDRDEAYSDYARGRILPLSDVLKIALAAQPGDILDVDYDYEDGLCLYEIEILARTGWVHELYIDARTGVILKNEAGR